MLHQNTSVCWSFPSLWIPCQWVMSSTVSRRTGCCRDDEAGEYLHCKPWQLAPRMCFTLLVCVCVCVHVLKATRTNYDSRKKKKEVCLSHETHTKWKQAIHKKLFKLIRAPPPPAPPQNYHSVFNSILSPSCNATGDCLCGKQCSNHVPYLCTGCDVINIQPNYSKSSKQQVLM